MVVLVIQVMLLKITEYSLSLDFAVFSVLECSVLLEPGRLIFGKGVSMSEKV